MEYIGTPNGVSAGVYAGPMVVYGASTIRPIIGESRYKGATASIDAEIQGSVNFIEGKSINPDGTPVIDPVSGREVMYREISAGIGVNAIPNAVDFGLLSGRQTTILGYYEKARGWPLSVR